ncbi:hypothetical protein Clacol_004732 [Clathrus columnatus]|uniref:NmrA-like domain-containing protein n=1 Tax=Clathrus columnatus TaxID=1419009 RepID=A0AAV5ADD7_9AGAM|nr:hypothetical protein Clacol_004732 [Clathrus columnatus]
MKEKKTIAVMGATGRQGGSVARFLLNDGTFAVKVLTQLIAKGAEVARADLDDVETLKKAFEGVYGVFGMTNFWEPGVGYEREIRQGKNLVDAAKAKNVKHFVWSTLDRDTAKPAHWESKAEVNDYLIASGVPWTSLYTSFFFENYCGLVSPQKQPDGSYKIPLIMIADIPFAVNSAAETGAFVLAAFLHPEEWINKDIKIATDFLSPNRIAELMSEVSGRKVFVDQINKEQFDNDKSLPEEVHNKYVLRVQPLTCFEGALQDNPGPPFRDPELTRKLYPEMKTFESWVKENQKDIFRN